MKTFFDVSGIKLDATGRVELPDASLPVLREVRSVAGGMNFDSCDIIQINGNYCDGWKTNESGCSNQANCGGDRNPLTCSNEMGCRQGENGTNCNNDLSCQESTNRLCSNAFTSGCSGSTNVGGQSTVCG